MTGGLRSGTQAAKRDCLVGQTQVLQKSAGKSISIQWRRWRLELLQLLAVKLFLLLVLLSCRGQLLLERCTTGDLFGVGQPEFFFAGHDGIKLPLYFGMVSCGRYSKDMSAELIDFAKQLGDVNNC